DLGLKVPEVVTQAKAQAELTLETLAEMNPDAIFLQFDDSENSDAPKALSELLENPIFKGLEASKNNKVFVNTIDPLAQGGTAWSKVRFLDAVVDNLLK
ncbi:ABC transporter substrate-binding protein, partial [Clostridium perfringens]|nr:ABC transporter substrate-binding protein [Clostridium perfringens]